MTLFTARSLNTFGMSGIPYVQAFQIEWHELFQASAAFGTPVDLHIKYKRLKYEDSIELATSGEAFRIGGAANSRLRFTRRSSG